jgi:hypothetical protein
MLPALKYVNLNHQPENNIMTLILFISAFLIIFGAMQLKEALEA